MSTILLATLNARYIHSAFGLRYLLANMGELQAQTGIREFVIHTRPVDIVEAILQEKPHIVGFGVYIWNVEQTTQVVALLKQVSPQTLVVVGGPEVSYEYDHQDIAKQADYLITGPADLAFAQLCHTLLAGGKPASRVLQPEPPGLGDLQLPYQYYTDEDIAQRIVYVEASRGCPYKCEFCLSALDKTVWSFDLDRFLQAMQDLYDRGARRFKFVDRTFNLKIDTSIRILEFFLARLEQGLFLHFELVPDHLPERLLEVIARFPAGTLQFEVGVQTFNEQVQALISRKQHEGKTLANLRWLRQHSQAHIHADLIIGLPGENLDSIARSFDMLVQLQPHEIQVGILKRLRGSPIIRHTQAYDMVYSPYPPYNVLSTSLIDFSTMQRLTRFARYWDLIGNSGHFSTTLPLILGSDAFARFLALSDWLYDQTAQTHKIALDRLFELVFRGVTEVLGADAERVSQTLWQDHQRTGIKKRPDFIVAKAGPAVPVGRQPRHASTPKRQARHGDN